MEFFRPYRQQKLRIRLLFAFVFTVLIPLIGTSLYGNWVTSRVLQSRAMEAAQTDLHLRRLQMEETLRGVEENLLFLSQMDSMTALIHHRSPDMLARAQIDLADFVATHPDIFQARFLDVTGQEVVRIDAVGDDIVLVPSDQLQNKADRYYFRETMLLPPGAIFVSPIDLNREFDRIEEPYTPTVRYGTPVFTADNARAGIVILNLYAAPLLQYAQGETLALLDEAGYFLAHSDPTFTWGGPNDLDTGVNGPSVYADIWESLPSIGVGILLPQPPNRWQALWEFLNPFVAQDDGRRALVYETVSGGNNRWRLVNDLPHATLFASVGEFRVTAILIVLWAMLLATGMAVLFARQIANPVQRLTMQARQFGQKRGSLLPAHPAPGGTRYEIDELEQAFAEMSAALEQQLTQLSQLNLAGRHIAAQLEEAAVLTSVSTAIHRLFPVDSLAISLQDELLYADGDPAWRDDRQEDLRSILLHQATTQGNWTTLALPEGSQRSGYLCCASLNVEGQLGLIEIYGQDAFLDSPAAGELLATLSVQISISLENAKLVKRLARRRAELQSLLGQLLNAQEEERRRIAYDIHDGLIQMLVGSRLQLTNFAAEQEQDPQRAAARLQKGMDGLGAAIVEARRVIEGLRPALLDDLGLEAATRHLAETACAEAGCTLAFVADLPPDRFPPIIETTAFRIIQEAITNAQKYAGMTHLSVRLEQIGSALHLIVRDNGRGFSPAQGQATSGGFGLHSMQERARLVGGDCAVSRPAGGGTAITATLPLGANP